MGNEVGFLRGDMGKDEREEGNGDAGCEHRAEHQGEERWGKKASLWVFSFFRWGKLRLVKCP